MRKGSIGKIDVAARGKQALVCCTLFARINSAMFEAYLVPEKTVVTAKGDGESVEVSGAQNRTLLVLLRITDAIEQESIDVTLRGSVDGETWEGKPLASFPQCFYRGQLPILLDLSQNSELKFIRAHWEVNRWGRGAGTPRFEFTVKATEVSPEILKQNP